jgi:hypothetical protein
VSDFSWNRPEWQRWPVLSTASAGIILADDVRLAISTLKDVYGLPPYGVVMSPRRAANLGVVDWSCSGCGLSGIAVPTGAGWPVVTVDPAMPDDKLLVIADPNTNPLIGGIILDS